jgi:hypothetical protein
MYIYLSSAGSRDIFPNNNMCSFSNALVSPLNNMQNYFVSLKACIVVPTPNEPVLISLDIIQEPLFNQDKLPVIGIYYPNSNNVASIKAPVANNSVSIIKCTISDVNHKCLSLSEYSEALILLEFDQYDSLK